MNTATLEPTTSTTTQMAAVPDVTVQTAPADTATVPTPSAAEIITSKIYHIDGPDKEVSLSDLIFFGASGRILSSHPRSVHSVRIRGTAERVEINSADLREPLAVATLHSGVGESIVSGASQLLNCDLSTMVRADADPGQRWMDSNGIECYHNERADTYELRKRINFAGCKTAADVDAVFAAGVALLLPFSDGVIKADDDDDYSYDYSQVQG